MYSWGMEPYNYGPRSIVPYNTQGTTDCSGGMVSALIHGGAQPSNPPVYTTVTISPYLESNGYKKIWSGTNNGATNWDIQPGDIVNMGVGSILYSDGGNGHIGVVSNNGTFLSVSAGDWGTYQATHEDQLPDYWARVSFLTYFEVWRNSADPSNINSNTDQADKPTKPDNSDTISSTKKSSGKSKRMWRYNDFIFGGVSDKTKKSVKDQSGTNKDDYNNTGNNGNNNNTKPPGNDEFGHIFKSDYYVVQPYGYTPWSMANPGMYPMGPGRHSGIDIAPAQEDGHSVYASADGTVLWIYQDPWGLWGICTDYKDGYYIYYGHLHDITVGQGSVIKRGDRLGIMGFANAWHVHYEYGTNPSAVGSANSGDIDPAHIIPHSGPFTQDAKITI